MKKLSNIGLLLFLLSCSAFANQVVTIPCTGGVATVVTMGYISTTKAFTGIPSCQIDVFNSGLTTHASIFDATGNPISNPFSAATNGLGQFAAANGKYDVVVSGSGITTTTYTGILINDGTDASLLTIGTVALARLPAPLNSVASATGSGSVMVMQQSPIINTPTVTGTATFTGAISAAGQTITAGVIAAVLNVPKRERDCTVDGLVVNDGTDQAAHFQACHDNAVANNQAILDLPCGTFKISTSHNATNTSSLKYRGCGAHNHGAGADVNTNTTQINCNTGNRPCMDFSGSSWTTVEEMGFNSLQTFSSPSQSILAYSRNNSGGGGVTNPNCYGQFNEIHHININTDSHSAYNGASGYVGIYNIGAEIMSIYDSEIVTDTPLWASTANDLSITSAYQTIQTGCPSSMSGFNSYNSWYTFGAGSLTLSDAFGFSFFNGGFVPGFSTTGSVFAIKGTASKHLVIKSAGVEPLAGTGAAGTGGVFVITATQLQDWDVDMNSQSSTGLSAMIQLAGAGETWQSNRVRINTSAGVAQQLMANTGAASHTFKVGEIDFLNSASPTNSFTGITLSGTNIKGPGFTDGNIGPFNAASNYFSQTDSGNVVHGKFIVDFIADSSLHPAGSGFVRCGNNTNCMVGRNAANGADIAMVSMGGDDYVHLGGFGTLQGTFLGGQLLYPEGFVIPSASGNDVCYGDTTSHAVKCSYNADTFYPVAREIARGTTTLGNGAINAVTCNAAVTTAATGVAATDSIEWSYASAPSLTTDGKLNLNPYVTANNVNFTLCNPTAGALTPTGLVVNWKVVRY